MILCSKCKKRPAVVFITTMQGQERKNEGLCLTCAKEMNIPQVNEYMEQMGISADELDKMSEQMMEIMDGESFEMGGAEMMPPFLQKLFSPSNEKKSEQDAAQDDAPTDKPSRKDERKKRKEEKKQQKELKFLNNYCTNLSQRAQEGKLDRIIG